MQHRICVLAKGWGVTAVLSRGERQLGYDARNGQRAAVVHLHAVEHAARLIVRVGRYVGDGVDAAGRHAHLFKFSQNCIDCALRSPQANRNINLGHARNATGVVGQCRIGAQIVTANNLH